MAGVGEEDRAMGRIKAIAYREAMEAGATFINKKWIAQKLHRSERWVSDNWKKGSDSCTAEFDDVRDEKLPQESKIIPPQDDKSISEKDDCLISFRWNNHKATFFQTLSLLRSKETYTDATLACDGKLYPVHKLVLSTCSDYFGYIFEKTSCKSPVVVLKDVRSSDLEALLDYMYLGEADVKENELSEVLRAAECLSIKGLAVPDDDFSTMSTPKRSAQMSDNDSSPSPKRSRRDSEECKKPMETQNFLDSSFISTPSVSPNSSIDSVSLCSKIMTITPSNEGVLLPNSIKHELSVAPNNTSNYPGTDLVQGKGNKRRLSVRTCKPLKLPKPIKIMKKSNKEKEGSISTHNESHASAKPVSKSMIDHQYVLEHSDGSLQKVGVKDIFRERSSRNIKINSSNQRNEGAGPSGVLSIVPSLQNSNGMDKSLEFCIRIGLPQFSAELQPYLMGVELDNKEKRKLAARMVDELAAHLERHQLLNVMNSRNLRSEFYVFLQDKIVDKYPNIIVEGCSRKKPKKGPLGVIISRVADRLNLRHRKSLGPSVPKAPEKPEKVKKSKPPKTKVPATTPTTTAGQRPADSEERKPQENSFPGSSEPQNSKVVADLENQPVTAGNSKNLPVTAGNLENQPVTMDGLENQPVPTTNLDNQPVTMDGIENQPVTSGNFENQPVTMDSVENQPVTAGNLENQPVKMVDLENKPVTIHLAENSFSDSAQGDGLDTELATGDRTGQGESIEDIIRSVAMGNFDLSSIKVVEGEGEQEPRSGQESQSEQDPQSDHQEPQSGQEAGSDHERRSEQGTRSGQEPRSRQATRSEQEAGSDHEPRSEQGTRRGQEPRSRQATRSDQETKNEQTTRSRQARSTSATRRAQVNRSAPATRRAQVRSAQTAEDTSTEGETILNNKANGYEEKTEK